jgi:hypothetical protein
MKPEKQRHAGDAEESVLGIDPRSDRGLEHLHGGADDVEQQDDLGLFERLQAEPEHSGLRGEEEKIVARQGRVARIDRIDRDQQAHHDAAEQAGPGLLHAEADEFLHEGGGAALAGPMAEPRLHLDEASERRPQGGGAGARAPGLLHGNARKMERLRRGGFRPLWRCKTAKEGLN